MMTNYREKSLKLTGISCLTDNQFSIYIFSCEYACKLMQLLQIIENMNDYYFSIYSKFIKNRLINLQYLKKGLLMVNNMNTLIKYFFIFKMEHAVKNAL